MLQPFPNVNAAALIRLAPSPHVPGSQIRDLGGGNVSVMSPRYLIYAEEVILVRNPGRVYRAADEVIDRLFATPC
jgi:hypothetical protein